MTELSVSTRPTHESYIRRIIRPVLGDVKARKIGPDTLDALNTHLKRWPKVLSIVSAALSLAKRYKWIDENPAESATMPSAGGP